MKIVNANISDADQILKLQKLAYISEAEIIGDYNIPPLTQKLEDTLEEFKQRLVLKAIVKNKIIGSVRAHLENGTCFIGKLIVHPDHQNKGIGTKLMNEIEAQFKHTKRFELFTSSKSQKNIYLYKKLGYNIFKEENINDKLTGSYARKHRCFSVVMNGVSYKKEVPARVIGNFGVSAMTKNQTIKATLKATKERRKSQTCRTFEVKIDRSHLNRQSTEHLKRLFLEAKWLYNHILAQQNNVFDMDYKLSAVAVKVKDTFETRTLPHLSSQMKQSLIKRTIDNIRGLARLKEKGRKIGPLKFKSRVNSIPLKQYGNTYKILNQKYIRIQGVKQKLRVNGLAQIPAGSELANAALIHRHGDYYLVITTYQAREQPTLSLKTVGIDFGITTQLTLSDGIAIQYSIPVSKKLRKLYKKLSKQQFRSKNWYKTTLQLEKSYAKVTNIKKDIKNKLIHYLTTNYRVVCYQNENIKAWQRLWGRKILSTAIGGIIGALETKAHTPMEIDRFFPSTKTCSRCGSIREIGLDERTYTCYDCQLIIDRDLNASRTLENEGLTQLGTGRTEVTPAETESSTLALEYLNRIRYVKASSVVETGSLLALA